MLILLCRHSQLVQGNPGNVTAALQQIQARTQQTAVTTLTKRTIFAATLSSDFLLSQFHWVLDSFNRMSNLKWAWVLPRDLCLWTLQPFMGRESCSQNLELEMQVNILDPLLQKWYLRWEHINTCIYKLIFALFLFVKTRHLVFKNKVLELILSCINLN